MIISISLGLIISGLLLFAFKGFDIPEIPLYLLSGALMSSAVSFGQANGYLSHSYIETGIVKELALLGLGILVFYTTSNIELDKRLKTSVDGFKSSLWLTATITGLVTGISLMIGFSRFESVLFGFASSVGSTMLDFGIVREKARSNHIYGRLTENRNFFTDILLVTGFSALITVYSSLRTVSGIMIVFTLITATLVSRKYFGSLMMKITDGVEEVLLLSGIMIFVSLSYTTEFFGLTALPGIFAAGLLLVDTELGYKIRERLSGIKDFFTALSFFSIGYLFSLPSGNYLIASIILIITALVLRPASQLLYSILQGYDLRTGFMTSLQTAHVSEITLLAALISAPLIGFSAFNTIVLAFAVSVVIAEITEDNEQYLFERLFSEYELNSEKSELPRDLSNHVIIAGYDGKTQGREDELDEKVVISDYSLERIEEAEERGNYHLLADLESQKTWDVLKADEAKMIVSAIDDQKVRENIKEFESPRKILASEDSKQVKDRLRVMLSDSMKNKENQ